MTMSSRCSVDQPVVNISYSSSNKDFPPQTSKDPPPIRGVVFSSIACDKVFAPPCHPLTIFQLHALIDLNIFESLITALGLRDIRISSLKK
ncbi:hypothetical protein Tco_1410059 [Tanacetum coccineum]